MSIKKSVNFPKILNLDKELSSIIRQANRDILDNTNSISNNSKLIETNTGKIGITKVGALAASGLYVATASGGSPTRQLNYRAVTLSDGTILNILLFD